MNGRNTSDAYSQTVTLLDTWVVLLKGLSHPETLQELATGIKMMLGHNK
jgi:hypothetical protein